MVCVLPVPGGPHSRLLWPPAAATVNAQIEWRQTPIIERTDALHRLADALRADRDQAADLITTEMGKRSVEALAEIDKSAWVCDYYADTAAGYLAPMTVDTGASTCFVQFPPLGTILAIMPWNYPVWQLMRAAAPAIAAGNAVILKHASNVTGSARLLLKIFDTAQMPASLLEVLVVDSSQVASVIADDRIAAVTLTGSETTGVAVATACASSLKKSVLELGGSDPFIVLEDADVEAAAKAAVTGRFLNTGQSCIAAKRFIVVESVAEAFETAFVKHTRSLVVGDPRDPATDIGPMARHDLRDELANQVQRGLEAGGRLLCGGTIPSGPGAFYAPTIVADVDPSNPLATEETFGPGALDRTRAARGRWHGGHIPFERDAKKALELALREAVRLGHGFIGTEHLLLGLLHEGRVRDVLVARGVGLDGTRALVEELVRKRQAG